MLHFFAHYILLLHKPLLFQKYICLFFQKRIFAAFFTSTIFDNMQSALLGVQIIADIFLLARKKTSHTCSVVFLKLFLLEKCLHINLMYWCQNT